MKYFMEFLEAFRSFFSLSLHALCEILSISTLFVFFSTFWHDILGDMYNNIIRPSLAIIMLWCFASLFTHFVFWTAKKIKLRHFHIKREKIKQQKIFERKLYIKSTIDNLLYAEIMLLKYILHSPTSVVHLPVDNPAVLALIDKDILSLPSVWASSARGYTVGVHANCASFSIQKDFLEYLQKNSSRINKLWKDIPDATAMEYYQ